MVVKGIEPASTESDKIRRSFFIYILSYSLREQLVSYEPADLGLRILKDSKNSRGASVRAGNQRVSK